MIERGEVSWIFLKIVMSVSPLAVEQILLGPTHTQPNLVFGPITATSAPTGPGPLHTADRPPDALASSRAEG